MVALEWRISALSLLVKGESAFCLFIITLGTVCIDGYFAISKVSTRLPILLNAVTAFQSFKMPCEFSAYSIYYSKNAFSLKITTFYAQTFLIQKFERY